MNHIQKIRQIIGDQSCVDLAKLESDTTFEDLLLDYLDVIELLMQIEDAFDVEIDESKLEPIKSKTISEFVAAILPFLPKED